MIQTRYRKLHCEEMESIGARWPENLTDADIARAGINWHIFPNQIVLPTPDGAQLYRARPNGDDPESCIYDVWWLERYGPGGEPPINHEYYPDIASFTGKNPFLEQDFDNLIACQAGMHSHGFRGMCDKSGAGGRSPRLPSRHRRISLWSRRQGRLILRPRHPI